MFTQCWIPFLFAIFVEKPRCTPESNVITCVHTARPNPPLPPPKFPPLLPLLQLSDADAGDAAERLEDFLSFCAPPDSNEEFRVRGRLTVLT